MTADVNICKRAWMGACVLHVPCVYVLTSSVFSCMLSRPCLQAMVCAVRAGLSVAAHQPAMDAIRQGHASAQRAAGQN